MFQEAAMKEKWFNQNMGHVIAENQLDYWVS